MNDILASTGRTEGLLPVPGEPSDQDLREIATEVTLTAARSAVTQQLQLILPMHGLGAHDVMAETQKAVEGIDKVSTELSQNPFVAFFGSAQEGTYNETTSAIAETVLTSMVREDIWALHGGADTGIMGMIDGLFHDVLSRMGASKSQIRHILLLFSRLNEQTEKRPERALGQVCIESPILALRTALFYLHAQLARAYIACIGGAGTMDEFWHHMNNAGLRTKTMNGYAGLPKFRVPPMLLIDQIHVNEDGSVEWFTDGLVQQIDFMVKAGTLNRIVLDRLRFFRPTLDVPEHQLIIGARDVDECASKIVDHFHQT